MLIGVAVLLTACASTVGSAGSGDTSGQLPSSVTDVTGHNNWYLDLVSTPEGVVECIVWLPDHDPGVSCNWGKFNAEHTTTTTSTTVFQP